MTGFLGTGLCSVLRTACAAPTAEDRGDEFFCCAEESALRPRSATAPQEKAANLNMVVRMNLRIAENNCGMTASQWKRKATFHAGEQQRLQEAKRTGTGCHTQPWHFSSAEKVPQQNCERHRAPAFKVAS